MRKLTRSIARAKMKKEGIRRMNKHSVALNPITKQFEVMPSYFAQHWREYI